MKVVFICGGVGKRMSPLSEDKFLLKFLGKTLLEYHIEQAKKAGLCEFVIICRPNNISKIKLITQNIAGADFTFATQKEPLGMANALQAAESMLSSKPIIVVNPNDVFEDLAYARIMEKYQKNSAACYILAYEVKEYFPGGYLVIDTDGEVKAIIEKPARGKEPSNLVNIVVHLHTQPKKFLEYTRVISTNTDDAYEQALDQMIRDGYKIKAINYEGFWKTIKYPWNIFPVMEYFLNRAGQSISPKAHVSPTALIDGDVIIEDNVKVLENAVIRGPCYIGRDSTIGNNVLIRGGSHIGEGCVVGHSTEIKHCYIGDKCWFHKNYFGDCVVGSDCSFGAGTITANLRLDESNISVKVGKELIDTGLDKLGAFIGDGVHTGIHVSLMPGVRVGARCFVGPHVCLTQDLPAGKMALTTESYKVVDSKESLES